MRTYSEKYYLDDGFRCSSKHCRQEKHEKGKDYGLFGHFSNCTLCKEECKKNNTCGGVDCGGTRDCTWWKAGICGSFEPKAEDLLMSTLFQSVAIRKQEFTSFVKPYVVNIAS